MIILPGRSWDLVLPVMTSKHRISRSTRTRESSQLNVCPVWTVYYKTLLGISKLDVRHTLMTVDHRFGTSTSVVRNFFSHRCSKFNKSTTVNDNYSHLTWGHLQNKLVLCHGYDPLLQIKVNLNIICQCSYKTVLFSLTSYMIRQCTSV